ncbi:MAG: transposase [Nevskiaceae bacterium]|jgi:transposase|nr:MAG: transposase [Nevskiaceae bacterium]
MQGTPTKRTRRKHAPDLKRQVVLACQQPGASVAGVSLAHGLNANLVRRWLREGRVATGVALVDGPPSSAFVEVPMPCATAPTCEAIRLELRRGASIVSLQWPVSAAAECGAWLREWLR